MATSNATITPAQYFKPGYSLNEANVTTFRDLYRTLAKTDRFDGQEIDPNSLIVAAQQLGIRVDSDNDQDILKYCVQFDDDENTFQCVEARIGYPVSLPVDDRAVAPASAPDQPEGEPASVTEIKCVLFIKRQADEIVDFLRTFLLSIPGHINGNE